jgi:hypothetical protein
MDLFFDFRQPMKLPDFYVALLLIGDHRRTCVPTIILSIVMLVLALLLYVESIGFHQLAKKDIEIGRIKYA